MNFIFSVDQDFQSYRAHYYYFVPYLLIYSVAVVDQIIFEFLPKEDFENLKAYKAFRRFTGLLLWTEKSKNQKKRTNTSLMKNLEEILKFECSNCKHPNVLKRADFELFFNTGILICEKCFQNILNSKESMKPIRNFLNTLNKV